MVRKRLNRNLTATAIVDLPEISDELEKVKSDVNVNTQDITTIKSNIEQIESEIGNHYTKQESDAKYATITQINEANTQISQNQKDIENIEKTYSTKEYVDAFFVENYEFGENETKITFNGKKVFCWKFNPDQTINLPNAGYVKIFENVNEIISTNIFCFNAFNDQHTQDRWRILPTRKRDSNNTEISFELTSDGLFRITNWVVTGDKKFTGYVFYTKGS